RALMQREWTSSGVLRAAEGERSKPGRVVPWAIAALAVVAAVAWTAMSGRNAGGEKASPAASPAIAMHVVVTDPDLPHAPSGDAPSVAISPDGATIVYTGRGAEDSSDFPGLYLRRADAIHARRLAIPCGDPGNHRAVYDPIFSPDGASIAFSCGGIYKMSLAGGAAVPLAENGVPIKGSSWSPRGIVFSPGAKTGLVLVKESGGPLETLTVPD